MRDPKVLPPPHGPRAPNIGPAAEIRGAVDPALTLHGEQSMSDLRDTQEDLGRHDTWSRGVSSDWTGGVRTKWELQEGVDRDGG